MKTLALAAAGVLIASTAALAQQQQSGQEGLMTSIPANSQTVTDWYKQNVYDQKDEKLGEIWIFWSTRAGRLKRHGRCRRFPRCR